MNNYFVNYLFSQEGAENSITASILYEANSLVAEEEDNEVVADEQYTDEPVFVGSRR